VIQAFKGYRVRPEVFSGLPALADFTRIEFSGLVLRLLKTKDSRDRGSGSLQASEPLKTRLIAGFFVFDFHNLTSYCRIVKTQHVVFLVLAHCWPIIQVIPVVQIIDLAAMLRIPRRLVFL
jgi:hypothetical protein